MYILLNRKKELRNIWWVAIFFIVLALLTIPFILLFRKYNWEITITHQAVMVIAATWISQRLRKRAFSEITGTPNLHLIRNLLTGLSLGAGLMAVPAFILFMCGFITWKISPTDPSALISATSILFSAAVTEEFIFRGFIFHRLISGIGKWRAQILMAAYFLLLHTNNQGMNGQIQLLASVNIFLASIMFGQAYMLTGNLAMPVGIHFMANWVQGILFGFGVSGNEQAAFFKPQFNTDLKWITGGSFGLEASLPGLITVIILNILLYNWRKPKHRVIT